VAEAITGTLTCADCSTTLDRKPGGGRPPKYCKPCVSQRGRAQQQAKHASVHGSPQTRLVCCDCTRDFDRHSLNGVPARRCPDCARQRELGQQYERLRQQREDRHATEGRRSTCGTCGEVFDCARKGPIPESCAPCRRKQATESFRDRRRAQAGPAPALTCRDCGVDIVRKPGSGATPQRCRPCALAKKREGSQAWRNRRPGPAMDGVCADCSTSFQRKSPNGPLPKRCPTCTRVAINMSAVTVRRDASRRRHEKAVRWSNCTGCGERLLCARKGPRRQRCSRCAETWVLQYRASKAAPARAATTCIDCGVVVVPARKGAARKRCGPCAAGRQRRQSESWKKAHPEVRRASWRRRKHRRRAAKRGAESEHFNDREIFERDRWKCQICGRKVDPKAKYPDPLSASLDHTVPLAEGGAHSRANTRCTHWICNSRRGDRGGNEQLMLIG
jgi:hypothetical protein